MRSLQERLTLGLLVATVILVVTITAIGSYALRHLLEEFVTARLEHDMDALLVALQLDQPKSPILDSARLNPIFRQPYSGHYYKIRVGDIELRSRSLWDVDLEVPATTPSAMTRFFSEGPQDQELLVLVRTFLINDRSVVVAVSEDFSPLSAGLRRLLIGFVLIAALLLGGLTLGQHIIVRQGLKPLGSVRRELPRLALGEVRQLDSDVPVEIRPLVEEINRLIALMEHRLRRSRHALGNLAHALKAPLTMLMQLANSREMKAAEPFGDELRRQTETIRLLMDRELKRARIAGVAVPGQQVVLTREVEDLVATLRKIHRDKDLAFELRIPPESLFPGDRDDLLELLGNLLDNACKWAAGRIRLTVNETHGRQRITVEDDGLGCASEQLERLIHRGVRIDESEAGHGLGLAIVADILQQYGGRLRLARSAALGGFLAEAELPCRS